MAGGGLHRLLNYTLIESVKEIQISFDDLGLLLYLLCLPSHCFLYRFRFLHLHTTSQFLGCRPNVPTAFTCHTWSTVHGTRLAKTLPADKIRVLSISMRPSGQVS
jgi:hypothetical protein